MAKPLLLRSRTSNLRIEKAQQEAIIAHCRPIIALLVWLAVSAMLASVYYAVESGAEEGRARANDEIKLHAGLVEMPPPPTPPPSNPPGYPPDTPVMDEAPGRGLPGDDDGLTPSDGGSKGPGSDDDGPAPSDGGAGPCGGGTDDDYSYGDEASYGREHRKLPRFFKDALAQARTTNLTEELIALRYYIMELENTCKQSPVTSESLNWTPAGSLFFAFTVMTTVSLPIERAQPCPTGD